MKKLLEIIRPAVIFVIIGGCVMVGMKAIDWAIPSQDKIIRVIVSPEASTGKIRI